MRGSIIINIMKVITEGHAYVCQNQEDKSQGQLILFINKKPIAHDATGRMETVFDGTTNEEVLLVLINRLEFLNDKFPSFYNETALRNLHSALAALNARTADREKRSVEGKAKE